MGVTGIDGSVQPDNNCDKEDAILVNMYQKQTQTQKQFLAKARLSLKKL